MYSAHNHKLPLCKEKKMQFGKENFAFFLANSRFRFYPLGPGFAQYRLLCIYINKRINSPFLLVLFSEKLVYTV